MDVTPNREGFFGADLGYDKGADRRHCYGTQAECRRVSLRRLRVLTREVPHGPFGVLRCFGRPPILWRYRPHLDQNSRREIGRVIQLFQMGYHCGRWRQQRGHEEPCVPVIRPRWKRRQQGQSPAARARIRRSSFERRSIVTCCGTPLRTEKASIRVSTRETSLRRRIRSLRPVVVPMMVRNGSGSSGPAPPSRVSWGCRSEQECRQAAAGQVPRALPPGHRPARYRPSSPKPRKCASLADAALAGRLNSVEVIDEFPWASPDILGSGSQRLRQSIGQDREFSSRDLIRIPRCCDQEAHSLVDGEPSKRRG